MMKKLIATFIILILGLTTTLSVAADSGISKKIGDKVILESGHESTYIGKTADGLEDIWQVNFSNLKYQPGTNIPIDCSWEWDSEKSEWYAKPNLFISIVKDTKVTVWNEGKKLSWQPDVYIGTKKLASSKFSELIFYDPINENYFGNTLQWNYGNGITRNLRIIEGMLIEYYIISTLPTDDILIIPHTTKDLGFVWTRPSSAWDANFESVPLSIGGNGELVLSLETIQSATLPITIDPDTTFTTSSSDGYLGYDEGDWDAVRDGSSANEIDTTGYLRLRTHCEPAVIKRVFLYFDTSSIPDGATVTDTTLRLYAGATFYDEDDLELWVRSGTTSTYPHNPLETGDYDRTLYSATDYGHVDVSTSWSTSQYNTITLTNVDTLISKTKPDFQ